MAALDAAIHAFAQRSVGPAERDARIESGHDECWRGSVGETAHRPDRMRMNFVNLILARMGHVRLVFKAGFAGMGRDKAGFVGIGRDKAGFAGMGRD